MNSIYLLTGIAPSGGIALYIGQTRNIKKRWKEHSGRTDFRSKGIAIIESCSSQEEADAMEQKWIGLFNLFTGDSLWNVMQGGQSHWPPEMVETIRHKLSVIGLKRCSSNEWKTKMSIAITTALKRPEYRAKLSAALKGKPKSTEHCIALSRASRLRYSKKEEHTKLSKAHKGKKLSEETRIKIAEANKIAWATLTVEQRAKRIAPAQAAAVLNWKIKNGKLGTTDIW